MAKQSTAQLPKYRRRYFPLYPRELDPDLALAGQHRDWFLALGAHWPNAAAVADQAPTPAEVVLTRPDQSPPRVLRSANQPVEPDRPVFTHLELGVVYDDGSASVFSGHRPARGYYRRLAATTLEGGAQIIAIARTPCHSQLLETASRLNRKRVGALWRIVLGSYLSESGDHFGAINAFLARHRFEPVEEPFGYAPIPNEWRNETVVGLLRACLRQKAYDRFPILADALEEAGCADGRLLAALRRDRREDVVGHEILIRCLNTPPEDEE